MARQGKAWSKAWLGKARRGARHGWARLGAARQGKEYQSLNKKEKDMEQKLFFGGIPTDVEIQKLREAYPESELTVGRLISYAELEDVIGCQYGGTRFRTITMRWRKMVEKETNIFIHPDPKVKGERFIVLSESEKVMLSRSQLKASGNKARRALIINSRIDRKQLEKGYLAMLDHQESVASKVLASAQIKSQVQLPEM